MKDFKRYIFFASLLVIVYLVAQYNKPKPIDWSATFSANDKIPHGTYILYNRLSDIFPKAKITTTNKNLFSTLDTNTKINSNYIIICDIIDFGEHEFERLQEYLKTGNNVFIASSYYGETFRKNFKIQTQTEFLSQEANFKIQFVNPNLGKENYYVDRNCSQTYFQDFDTTKAIILGKNNQQHVNFLKFKVGKGALHLSANPLLFTNYSLLKKDGAAYTAKSLSYMNLQGDVFWDQFYSGGSKGSKPDSSTMQVFLKYPQLQWAFYIAFFSLLLYVIYQMKRRQRIIPIIDPLTNSTVDFATVVGQVYYEQQGHLNIAQKKISYFLEYLRNRYQLKTTVPDDDFLNTLAKKSGVELSLIKNLFQQITIIHSAEAINSQQLIALNTSIEQFHIQSL